MLKIISQFLKTDKNYTTMKEIITLHDFHAVCEYLNQDLLDDYLGAFYDARWYPSDEMMRRHSEAAAKLWEDFDKDDPVFFDMDKAEKYKLVFRVALMIAEIYEKYGEDKYIVSVNPNFNEN